METNEAYDQWVVDPTPDTMAGVLNSVSPTVTSEIQRYSGPKPLLRSKARTLAIKAVKSYDPTRGAKLSSWVVTQMQPLSRYSQRLKPVRSSEVAVRQAAEMDTQRRRFELDEGREPTDVEMADIVGISAKRVRLLRDKVNATAPESSLTNPETSEIDLPPVMESGTLDFASEAVYHGLQPREKLIFNWKTGLHGKKQLENQEIARRLGISPAAVSQTTAVIAERIRKASSDVI